MCSVQFVTGAETRYSRLVALVEFVFNFINKVISSLEAGCPVDIRDEAGNTLFIIAAQNGNKNMCKV
jgi:hypothetical protein